MNAAVPVGFDLREFYCSTVKFQLADQRTSKKKFRYKRSSYIVDKYRNIYPTYGSFQTILNKSSTKRRLLYGSLSVHTYTVELDISDLCKLRNLAEIRYIRRNFYCFVIRGPKIIRLPI